MIRAPYKQTAVTNNKRAGKELSNIITSNLSPIHLFKTSKKNNKILIKTISTQIP